MFPVNSQPVVAGFHSPSSCPIRTSLPYFTLPTLPHGPARFCYHLQRLLLRSPRDRDRGRNSHSQPRPQGHLNSIPPPSLTLLPPDPDRRPTCRDIIKRHPSSALLRCFCAQGGVLAFGLVQHQLRRYRLLPRYSVLEAPVYFAHHVHSSSGSFFDSAVHCSRCQSQVHLSGPRSINPPAQRSQLSHLYRRECQHSHRYWRRRGTAEVDA